MLLEEIPNLSHADPKVSKGAALKLLQYVSENKEEVGYLVKRLVTGMESVKITTRAGSYASLTSLLSLGKVDPLELFDVMEKCLITNKESTKKERRLIYIARILCTGAIFRTIPAVNLAKDVNFLPVALKELVDLSQKKSTYFLLTTPFLSHLLQDNTLTQETFDNKVWPTISILFGSDNQSKANKKKKKAEQDDETSDEDEEKDEGDEGVTNWNKFCCQVQLALNIKNGEYKTEFQCLEDPGKIAKALLISNLQFEEVFLTSLFKHLSGSSTDQIQIFWESLLDNIKSTQFDLLCLSVKTAMKAMLPISAILSRKLVRLLVSVFKLEDKEFHKKAKETIDLLLKWGRKKNKDAKDKSPALGKKERKNMLKILFDVEDPPNLLHEYKFLHPVIRPFLLRLTSRELEHLCGILLANLFENYEASKLGPRMAIVYLQTLGKIAHCPEASSELRFQIGEKLLNIALGKEEIPIKSNKESDTTATAEGEKKSEEAEDDADPETSFKGVHEQIKKCSLSTLQLVLSSTYNAEFITMMSTNIIENLSELTSNPETIKMIKDIKKILKKHSGPRAHPQLEYILRAYGIRVLLDEEQPISTTNDMVQKLIDLMKTSPEGDDLTELWKFITDSVVREPNPPFNYEGLFNKLLMEGKVNDEVMQVFAEAIDVELEPEADDEEDEDESGGDEDESKMEVDDEVDSDSNEESGDEDDSSSPPKKKSKLDPAQIEKLKEKFGGESDSEESINLDEATEEDLQKMDGALAKVFAVKRSMKEEERSGERALMRNLRLVDLYIRRHIKDMPVSSLLILLMPVVHSLQRSLKLRKSQLPTRVIGILDNLNRVKKFAGCDMVVEGTLATLAEELFEMGQQKKNKLIRELLDHSVILMTKCFVQKTGKKSKKEQKRFIAIYCRAVDVAKSKIKGRRKTSGKKGKNKQLRIGGGNLNTSRFVRLALETFSEWEEGKKAIQERINMEVEA